MATTEQQLSKVKRVSSAITVLLQIAQAFAGISIAITLIALAVGSSFQLNLGDGDFGITFFKQEQSGVVLNLYDTRDRFGANYDSEVPETAQLTRIETELSMPLRVAAGIMFFLHITVVMLVLEHLSKLFAHYAKGEIFTRAAVSRIHKIGYTLLGLPLISLLNSVFAYVLISRVADTTSAAAVDLAPDMKGFFLAIFVLLISWIMDVGRAMREENELTI